MFLYRGVNSKFDLENNGELRPFGNKLSMKLSWGDTALSWDDEDIPWCDISEVAAIKYHQADQKSFGSAWISTSKSEEEARKFATIGGMVNGVVYVLDTDRFKQYGVIVQPKFKTPNEPHEQEVSIAHSSGGSIPKEIIVDRYDITAEAFLGRLLL